MASPLCPQCLGPTLSVEHSWPILIVGLEALAEQGEGQGPGRFIPRRKVWPAVQHAVFAMPLRGRQHFSPSWPGPREHRESWASDMRSQQMEGVWAQGCTISAGSAPNCTQLQLYLEWHLGRSAGPLKATLSPFLGQHCPLLASSEVMHFPLAGQLFSSGAAFAFPGASGSFASWPVRTVARGNQRLSQRHRTRQ